jgi:hypothetical protein
MYKAIVLGVLAYLGSSEIVGYNNVRGESNRVIQSGANNLRGNNNLVGASQYNNIGGNRN